jgi:bifunctional non-homologous end joining protein LigD
MNAAGMARFHPFRPVHSAFHCIKAASKLPAKSAYLDGELCAVEDYGTTSFSEEAVPPLRLVLFTFDLLYIDGEDLTNLPLIERKQRLKKLLKGGPDAFRYSDHVEGVLWNSTKLLVKWASRALCQSWGIPRTRLVIASCGRRPSAIAERNLSSLAIPTRKDRAHLGSLLLGYYDRKGSLQYAGHGAGGMSERN